MNVKEKIKNILVDYTKKNGISASVVILENYAEELVKNGIVDGTEVSDLQDELKCAKETNERLCVEYLSAKAYTIRKMQERLKQMVLSNFPNLQGLPMFIDQIAKEMLEGK